tara:strand:+ start:19 stop:246 length:228 start_codon:yes stop_codon:yes gene_type:complete
MVYLENKLFSPLSREYCAYFYYLTVFTLIFFVIAAVEAIYSVMKGDVSPVRAIVTLVAPFIIYFQNRLLYSMCLR